MMKRLTAVSLALLGILCLCLGPLQAAETPDDANALKGVTQGRVVFDINIAEPNKLPLYLTVIDQTISDLERQGVKPEVILAFRGKAVTLISTDYERIELTDLPAVEKAAEQLAALQKRGVRMEACSVATRLFGVDHSTLLPGIEPVGNTFVSLIGYQAQGYASIAVY
jgi:intracellular sulfur oxidation DsrE/DsrF family protein